MSFGWLGVFRQGQWQAFRRFTLEERRDVSERLRVIRAELARIGEVTVYYGSEMDDEGNVSVSEERLGFEVSPGSSLSKLLRAYVAMGGNPFDISLFLTPDQVLVFDETDEDMPGQDVQPSGGVVYPQSASYSTGGTYTGGFASYKKDLPARVGGRRVLEDSAVASQVAKARGWVNQEIRYKRNDIEARIIKLCDLREQLLREQEDIIWAAAGAASDLPFLDPGQFDPELTVANIVAVIDSLFYAVDEDGRADFNTANADGLAYNQNLLPDISPDEDNTAL